MEEYQLERVALNLTRHWMTKYPTEVPTKEQRYSLRSVMPPHTHAFRTAIGDLNGDQVYDYVFALEPVTGFGEGDNLRDLQIVFTTYGGFQQKLFSPASSPAGPSGASSIRSARIAAVASSSAVIP